MSTSSQQRLTELEGAQAAYEQQLATANRTTRELSDMLQTVIRDLERERAERAADIQRLAQNPPQAAAAVAVPTPSTREMAVKPEPWSGKHYKDFIHLINVYFAANRALYTTDEAKILFTLSLMREGTAGPWAQNFIDGRTQPRGLVILDSWNDFTRELNTSFGDINEAQHAQEELLTIQQGTLTAEEFFQRLDILRRKAGYVTGYDQFLIRILERSLRAHLVDSVLSMPTIPDTYEGWKVAATHFDGNRRRRDDAMRNRQSTAYRRPFPPPIPPRPAAPRAAPAQAAPRAAPPPVRRDATGVTFGGAGEPMDVAIGRANSGRRCFLCGSLKHLVKDCDQRTTRVRLVLRAMGEELAEEMVNELGAMRESDFQVTPEEQDILSDDNHADLPSLASFDDSVDKASDFL